MPMIIDGTNGLTFPDTSRQYNGYFGFKNRIINGDMRIDQRNNGASVNPGTGAYTVDRWNGGGVHDGVLAIQRVADAPTGFVNSLRVTVSTADSSLGAAQYARVGQIIEGFNVADLAGGTASAATITFSFWVKSSLTGTFGGYLANGDETRAYVFQYTINAANTWEQKSVTVTLPSSGTWATDNSAGMRAFFSLGSGSNYINTPNTWLTSIALQASGNINVINTLGATFYITGVQLEEGVVSTNFDVLPYGTQLQLCQRYYQRNVADSTFPAFSAGVCDTTSSLAVYVKYTTSMRASPTLSYGGNLAAYSATVFFPVTAVGTAYLSRDSALWQPTIGGGGMTVGRGCVLVANNSTTAYFDLSAEL